MADEWHFPQDVVDAFTAMANGDYDEEESDERFVNTLTFLDFSSENFFYDTEEEAEEGFHRLVVSACVEFREDGAERTVEGHDGASQRINQRFVDRHPEYDEAYKDQLYSQA